VTDIATGATRRRGDVFALYAEIYALRLGLDVPAAGQDVGLDVGLGSGPCDTDLSAAVAAPSPALP
jgi:hypothetical protein